MIDSWSWGETSTSTSWSFVSMAPEDIVVGGVGGGGWSVWILDVGGAEEGEARRGRWVLEENTRI